MKRWILPAAIFVALIGGTVWAQDSPRTFTLMTGNAVDSTDDFSDTYDIRVAGFTPDTKGTFSKLATSIVWVGVGDSLAVKPMFQVSLDGTQWLSIDSSATQIVSADSILASDNIRVTSGISGYPYFRLMMRVDGVNDKAPSTLNAYTIKGFFSK